MSKVDATKFVLQCQNWYEIALPIATHKTPARVILKNGIRFNSGAIYWPDVWAIFHQGIYTPHNLPIERDDVVVDIGANIGVFTIYAATRTQNTVYAIEPFPSNFACLEHNIRANRSSNAIPLRFAVSDKSGTALLLDAGASQHHRLNSFVPDLTKKCIEVPSITLRDFMDRHQIKQIDFLKLDCEGAEEAILLSTPKAYLQRVRKIAMEFHDQLTHLKHDELRKLLQEAGFSTELKLVQEGPLGFLYGWRA